MFRFLANMSSNQAGVYRGGNTTGTTGTTGTTSGTTGNTGELRNTTGTAGTGVISAQRGEPVCDQKYYTKVGVRRPVSFAAVCSLQYINLTLSSFSIAGGGQADCQGASDICP